MSPGNAKGAGPARVRADAGAGSFVNPYTFLPWPDRPGEEAEAARRAPAGHDRLGGRVGAEPRFAGSVTVELACRSPLMLRNVVRERATAVGVDGQEYAQFPRRTVSGPGGEQAADLVPFIPGSSLAGVFRSLHEALAGGCLRVFDAGFTPGYRDKPLALADRNQMLGLQVGAWMMAVVQQVDPDGVPLAVQLCDQVVWTPVQDLARVLKGAQNVRSGAQVSVTQVPPPDGLGRRVIEDPDTVVAGQGWTILLTDAGARLKEPKKDGSLPTYYCATGRLEPQPRTVGLDDAMWQRFVAAARGSDDMRRARAANAESARRSKSVRFRNQLVGFRDAVRDRLFVGQVVWLFGTIRRSRDDVPGPVDVQAISLAQIWRHGGTGSAGKRVPDWLWPGCCDPQELCPSCRVFGAADTEGGNGPAARQDAYRGHVRFSDALPIDTVESKVFALAPLGAPRPGAGQMYLQHTEEQLAGRARKPAERRRPLREWGSGFDGRSKDGFRDPAEPSKRGLRPLRGRKQYWLTGDPATRPFFRAVADRPQVFSALYDQTSSAAAADDPPGDNASEARKENALLARAEAVLPGARFRCRVHFENLTVSELGGLLAALDPGLLLADGQRQPGEFGIAVGGGRPLGFGTCTTVLHDLVVEDAAARYLGEPAPQIGAGQAMAAFRRDNQAHLATVWQAMGAVLRPSAVPDWQVWYPPAGALAGPERTLDPVSLMASFEFWQHSEGFRGKEAESVWPLMPLPALGPDTSQSMPVVVDAKQLRVARERLAKTQRPPQVQVQPPSNTGELE